MGWFDLEKKKDGLYRCKGGHLADFILLFGGIIYASIMVIITTIGLCIFWLAVAVFNLFSKIGE